MLRDLLPRNSGAAEQIRCDTGLGTGTMVCILYNGHRGAGARF